MEKPPVGLKPRYICENVPISIEEQAVGVGGEAVTLFMGLKNDDDDTIAILLLGQEKRTMQTVMINIDQLIKMLNYMIDKSERRKYEKRLNDRVVSRQYGQEK